jgi:RNA polymerase sigma-32 factor
VIAASFVSFTVQNEIGIVQQMVSPNSGVLTGANFNQDNRDGTQQNWQRYYRNVIRFTADVINATKDQPTRSNLYNMARIWQANAFIVVSDSYGDVPYTEAGKGYIAQVLLPKYDAQQAIYAAIIKELTEATAALDAAKTVESADVLYGGNIALWKKLGNSLLLRAGMRLTKVAPALAQATVQKAAQGPLMDANTDNCVIRHDANYVNGIGQMLNSTEANNFYLAAPFVNQLKSTADPRLSAIAVRYVGAKSGPEQTAAKAKTDAASQIGMPFGFAEQKATKFLADRAFQTRDLAAAQALIVSHLRLVVSIARGYLGYGLPHADLIQEGNVGLMKAVKRYDPEQGVRLVSYAMHWIKAEIHEYILRNWRMVKLATTKAQRKLFFNLRSHKPGLDAMTPDQVDDLAATLKVKREEVIEMEMRMAGRDVALEAPTDDEDDHYAPISYLSAEHSEPHKVLEAKQFDHLQSEGLEAALAKLDDRSRRIVEARWLANDDGSGATLHELAAEFGVSAERIRQIETAAMKKMKTSLAEYA